ncbi:unnamed protein product [Gulo gulo]|uniref:Uncharacterized protein n=1 Tax=Gulo gulo TaxID=48420 RepID=A0A9X9Q7D7_GULGU|nr:unnamed protein product [Gulo gulo]
MRGRGQGAAAVRLRCHRLPDSHALKADSEAGCARSILCFHCFKAFKKKFSLRHRPAASSGTSKT